MARIRTVLGIEIRKDSIRIAEVEHREDGFFVSKIGGKTVESLKPDGLVQEMSSILREWGMRGRIASVAIDTTMTHRGTVDVDDDWGTEEIVDFLKAEINFHDDFSSREYKPAYEIRRTFGGYKEIFYAAIDTTLLASIKSACTKCGLNLQFIDLDHSCSELAIKKLLNETGTYLLITIKDYQVEGSISKDGDRLAYKHLSYQDDPVCFVTKLVQDLEPEAIEYAGKIFVTGSKIDEFLLDVLQKNVDKRFELLDLTSKIAMSHVVSTNEEFQKHPHYFSHVIGAALK